MRWGTRRLYKGECWNRAWEVGSSLLSYGTSWWYTANWMKQLPAKAEKEMQEDSPSLAPAMQTLVRIIFFFFFFLAILLSENIQLSSTVRRMEGWAEPVWIRAGGVGRLEGWKSEKVNKQHIPLAPVGRRRDFLAKGKGMRECTEEPRENHTWFSSKPPLRSDLCLTA